MTMDLKQLFAEQIYDQIKGAFPVHEILAMIEKPKHSKLGDFAFPCFQLARILKNNPNTIASTLASGIHHPRFAKIHAVGPYVNVFLNQTAFSQDLIQTILRLGSQFGAQNVGQKQHIVFDLSSPNIAKPFSMGHLRSTIIGNSLALIAEKMGYQSVRINYIGDWGTQFGKLITAYRLWGTEEEVRQNSIQELFKLYVHFHEQVKTHPELEDEGRKAFKSLEQGDSEAISLWKWFREESLQEFQKIYDLMGISFDCYNGESYYNDKMAAVIQMLNDKQLLQLSDGAYVVPLDEHGLPSCLVVKSDGATIYPTRDLTAAIDRYNQYQFAKALYIVGHEQSLHFKQVKLVLEKAGYSWAKEIEHIPFGLILQNGKKMSTRKGRVVLLEEVLTEAIDKVKQIIQEKNPHLKEKESVAKQVGVGAIFFHDLKNERLHDVEFDLESMLQFEGETGPYIQFTNVRCHSILRKAQTSLEEMKNSDLTKYSLEDPEAWSVLTTLATFPEIIEKSWTHYDPSKITRFACDVARSFNQYYAQVHILDGSPQQDARLKFVASVAIILEEALRLLGIRAPKEM